MRTRPVVDAAAVGFGDLGIHAGLALQLQGAAGGDVDVDGFIEVDIGLVEFVVGPELSGGQRGVNDRDHVVFEHFAGTQAGNRDVLLAIVGVDGGFALDGSAQILDGIVARFDHRAVFFQHAHVGNFDALVGGVVTLLQLSPLLHAGFALHANAGGGFFASGAVGFEAIVRVHLLDDEGLLGIVSSLGVGLRGVGGFFRGVRRALTAGLTAERAGVLGCGSERGVWLGCWELAPAVSRHEKRRVRQRLRIGC